jgi:DNA-binding NtrC family response regulator
MGIHRPAIEAARILVVEDCEDLCLLLEIALHDEGYAVDCASSAEDGLQKLNSRRYHLLLTDYSLPGHSGAWLLSQAQRQRQHDHTPSVMITGDPDAPGIPRDVTVVRKPLDFDRLLRDIRRILQGSELVSASASREPRMHPGQMAPSLSATQSSPSPS